MLWRNFIILSFLTLIRNDPGHQETLYWSNLYLERKVSSLCIISEMVSLASVDQWLSENDKIFGGSPWVKYKIFNGTWHSAIIICNKISLANRRYHWLIKLINILGQHYQGRSIKSVSLKNGQQFFEVQTAFANFVCAQLVQNFYFHVSFLWQD